MPQKIIPIIENERYHVFNRGVDKRDIFLDKADYLRFYQSLSLFNSKFAVVNFDSALLQEKRKLTISPLAKIYAYSLLPNHFHLIIESVDAGGLSEFMRRVSSGYTSYFNQKYERSGTLFQGTFKRVLVENQEQYQYLFAYVNENHFVHGVTIEREICHSSSLHYQEIAKSKLIRSIPERPYQYKDNIALAMSIYEQRTVAKLQKELLE